MCSMFYVRASKYSSVVLTYWFSVFISSLSFTHFLYIFFMATYEFFPFVLSPSDFHHRQLPEYRFLLPKRSERTSFDDSD